MTATTTRRRRSWSSRCPTPPCASTWGEKARRYAIAGVPLYWVVDVHARVVHVHTDPRPDGTWASVQQVSSGRLDAQDLGLSVELDDLLDF